MINKIILDDCMNVMPLIPQLGRDVMAIVDPPYRDSANNKPTEIMRKKGGMKKWVNKPGKEYFDELFRISNDQIVWGGNYFTNYLEPTNNWIIWDKKQYTPTYSRAELAWCSTDKRYTRIFEYRPMGNLSGIHPTEKPVVVYRWLLQNYAKPGQLILDTHSGSGALACACDLEGFDFIAVEKDPDYHRDSVNRLDELRSQGRLF